MGSSRPPRKLIGGMAVENASGDGGLAPIRRIGPVGTATRVAGGLAAIALPVALHGITWWDLGAALVVLPLIAALAAATTSAALARYGADRPWPRAAESWLRSTLALALSLGIGIAVTFVSPVDGTAIWLFIGLSLLIAALRGDAGCEVIAIPNALAGRRDPIGCVIYAPIDAAEARRATKRLRDPLTRS
jgi:hypothetical protein